MPRKNEKMSFSSEVKSKLFNKAKIPGELVQIDTKFLPRKKYQYTAIDVVSKWRCLKVYPKR